ncbi:nucleotidyltransferase domain-containing protein [Actinosynnema sp. ALI-1.44]|uniref:nucleotidyltransferase domain-containing protein n=1 Tax=Actinosynnema sp. ALI-1.44 TaxID=1933779 RepID=UPI001177687A|nr:amino acid transporter [Actinosynnema sp. ALI-1.44]
MSAPSRGKWQPATPPEVAELFSTVDVPWWIAGGYAIESHVGHAFREHGDIDVMLLRRDQSAVQQALAGWEWWAADPPGELRPWRSGEVLPSAVHDIWCRPAADQPWRIQIILDESDGEDWVSRRDPRIRRPITTIGLRTTDGIPYLAPEIQLFYKAKDPREKDEADLAAVRLDPEQRDWLDAAVATAYGV